MPPNNDMNLSLRAGLLLWSFMVDITGEGLWRSFFQFTYGRFAVREFDTTSYCEAPCS